MGAYLPILLALNLVLLISSTAMLYLGSILVNFYLLPSLSLVSSHFATVPYLILVIGIALLVISIFGFIAAGSKSRIGLVVYSVLMGATFVVQLASVFTTLELRNEMIARVLNAAPQDVYLDMEQYWMDPDVKEKWDTLQRDFQCCGVLQHNTGYKDWQRISNWGGVGGRTRHGVPDSCCLTEVNNCGLGAGEGIFQDLYPGHSIFTHGCLTILEGRLERDVEPVLISYIGCAVVLALLQILGLVLAAAYVAAITRKMKPEGDRRGMYQHPGQAYPGAVGYEESLYNRTKPYSDTIDSGITGSLRSTKSSRSNLETELKGSATPLSVRRLEDASHRSSIYIEPSNEEGTQI